MSLYKHGTCGEFSPSIGRTVSQSGTVAVYIGTAPVNLVRGYAEAGVINEPVLLTGFSAVQRKTGYAKDWAAFTLCQPFSLHFDSEESVGPIVAINVLDPDVHRKDAETVATLTFVNGRATINSSTIILDTLVLLEKQEGVDYSVDYDFVREQVIIQSLGDEEITGDVDAVFFEVDPSMVKVEDVVGGVTAGGEHSGIGSIGLIYPTLNLIPNLIAAPGWSHDKAVYTAMVKASTKINGHWDAFVCADIPVVDGDKAVDTIEKAIQWKKDKGYTSERAKVCWPQGIDIDGRVYHLSALWAWRQMLVDETHDGIHMETASNKKVPVVKQFFGPESRNRGFDQIRGNELNESGISTIVFFGGVWVLWGPHTAAFDHWNISDNRVIFDNSIRMMMYQSNSFQKDWALTIDQPMTRAMKDTIQNREQEKADALAAMGALIGTPVVRFDEAENSTDEMIQGNFVWVTESTPTPPFKSGTMKVAYTTAGFESYFGEEA